MAKSRYAGTPIIDNHHYGTWTVPVRARGLAGANIFDGVRTFSYTISLGDRPDHLAARFLNDDTLWWLICLGNGIIYPFSSGGWKPGREIQIPLDPKDVLDKLMR